MLKSTATRSLRTRIAVLAVAGLAALSISTAVAQADTSYFGTGNGDTGSLSILAACDYFNQKATVSLTFQTPFSETNGLWVQTSLYYKDSNNPSWSVLAGPSTPQFAKTSQGYGTDYAINTTVDLVGASFYGTHGRYYDVGVYYRIFVPRLSMWTSWKWLKDTADFTTNFSYGQRWISAGRCGL